MKVVLESAQLAASVKQPVVLGIPFSVELMVSPGRPGLEGVDAVTLECLFDGYSVTPRVVMIAIPPGAKTHTQTVPVTLHAVNPAVAAVVVIKASALNVNHFLVMVRDPAAAGIHVDAAVSAFMASAGDEKDSTVTTAAPRDEKR